MQIKLFSKTTELLNCKRLPKFTHRSRGILLIDILVAFSLTALFIVIMNNSSIEAREIFETAKIREQALGLFRDVSHPFEWYGNDMAETISNISVGASQNPKDQLIFHKIRGLNNRNYFEEINSGSNLDIGGPPICSVNFDNSTSINLEINPILLTLDPSLPLTDLEVRNGIAYISADSTVSADPDLFIFDIKDPQNVRLISSLNTGPGLSSITLAGRRIYASAPSTAGQLHIIRLDSLDHPILENRYRLSLPYATATPALGSAIFYQSGQVYLGTEKWDGEEFNVIDLSNPLAPTKLGGYEIGSKVNDIFSYRGLTYVTGSSHDQLLVFDSTDPASSDPAGSVMLNLVQTFSPSGWERQEGKIISFFEQKLGLGRTSGGFDLSSDHEAFVWATTSTSTLASFSSLNIPSGVYGFLQDRSYIYLATRQLNKEFQIWDQNLSTTTATFSLPIAPQTMTCDIDSIYILANRAPFIYKITFR